MIENILQNNGFGIAASGIVVVFCGLVLIAIVIYLFNRLFEYLQQKPKRESKPAGGESGAQKVSDQAPTAEELAAITVALECYRKIHFEPLQSKITFRHGEQQSAWKLGYKHDQRRRSMR